MLAEICLAFVVLGISAYAVLGSADFGAGFWDLTAGGAQRGGRLRGMVQRSMSPVWEANHVWLIFVLVIAWTAFPVAFGSITSTLYVPLFLAAVGIIFRGTAFALRGQAATMNEARTIGAVFALASVLIPFFLGAAVGGIASGRVRVGNLAGDPITSWLNPSSVLIGVLAVLTGAYLAAVYLAGDSARAGLPDLVRAFRARALGSGVVTGVVALGGLLVLRSDARALFDGLTSGLGLVLVIASALAGAATMGLVWRERFGLARPTAAVAVTTITVGWAVAQDPYLLPPQLTLDEAAASDATLGALVASIGVGALILIPSLTYLYRLVLRGQLDQEFEPLDQRFRPLSASDAPEARTRERERERA
jgi:cytochrome d ubiquinol oxidase subunit II